MTSLPVSTFVRVTYVKIFLFIKPLLVFDNHNIQVKLFLIVNYVYNLFIVFYNIQYAKCCMYIL